MITYTFLTIIVVFSIYCFNDRSAMSKYLFHPYSIYHNKEHYRFLTHAFIHGDFIHLIFNCLALYSFGITLEEDYFGNDYYFNPKIGKLYYMSHLRSIFYRVFQKQTRFVLFIIRSKWCHFIHYVLFYYGKPFESDIAFLFSNARLDSGNFIAWCELLFN